MGQICDKLSCQCRSWRYCSCCHIADDVNAPNASSRNRLEKCTFKVLILGASGSGKTEVGFRVSGQRRDNSDIGPTNGVRCFRAPITAQTGGDGDVELVLTEVGGSEDMQRLWPHYYATTHALIYCFDLSANYDTLRSNFTLLEQCLCNEAMRGKAILVVGTRHRDGVQLYDVENTFGLAAMARSYHCPVHACSADSVALRQGVEWLCRQLQAQRPALSRRLNYDINMMVWQQRKRALLSSGKLAQVHRERFRRHHRKLWPLPQVNGIETRPQTAPAKVFSIESIV